MLAFPKLGRVLPKPLQRAPKHDPVVELAKEDNILSMYEKEAQEEAEREGVMGVEQVPRTFRTL